MSARRDVQEAARNARRKQSGRADAATGEVLGLDALVKRDSDGYSLTGFETS